jgi:ClpP class serine protease
VPVLCYPALRNQPVNLKERRSPATWGDQLKELGEIRKRSLPRGISEFGILRRRYLKALADRTGRAVIVYATAYMEPRPTLDSPQALSVHLGDIQGFMEAVSNVQEREVDLFLHSPGGSAEAAQSIVEYLRTRFDHIRVIVPGAAMSAATMIALSADEIVMGAHSQLGPIDPQFTIPRPRDHGQPQRRRSSISSSLPSEGAPTPRTSRDGSRSCARTHPV